MYFVFLFGVSLRDEPSVKVLSKERANFAFRHKKTTRFLKITLETST